MTDKERINEIINSSNMSARRFGEYIGIKTPQVLYDIIKGRNGISKDLAEKISAKCVNYNIAWLLTGEGEMLKEPQPTLKASGGIDEYAKMSLTDRLGRFRQGESNCLNELQQLPNVSNLVPLLPISAQGGSLNDFVLSVKNTNCERINSPIDGADFAMPVAGDSMAPEYPSGSQLLIKKINEHAFIEWGKVYVLDTCNGSIIKEIHQSNNDDEVLCVSINKDPKYKSFSVKLNDIYGMYKVLLCMSIK